MRKFALENSTGERLSLHSNTIMLYEPSGLGIGESREYGQQEYGFYGIGTHEYEQPVISGTLLFLPGTQSPYKSYQEFVEWVQAAKNLKLVYVPYPGRELYMDVTLDRLELGELTKVGVLECPVTFSGLSPYHKRNPLMYAFRSTASDNPMRFTFRFPFRFTDSGAEDAVVFSPQGHYPAALEAVINGPVSNPRLICSNANTGEVYGDLDLTGVSVAEGDRIHYSSMPNADGIWLISGGGVRTDLTGHLNINNNNWIRVPVGVSCRARLSAEIGADEAQIVTHALYVHEYYKG